MEDRRIQGPAWSSPPPASVPQRERLAALPVTRGKNNAAVHRSSLIVKTDELTFQIVVKLEFLEDPRQQIQFASTPPRMSDSLSPLPLQMITSKMQGHKRLGMQKG